MLQGIIALGQLLWPFLKESVFGNASFKQWLKHNITTAMLFTCIVLMFLAALHLASMLAQERQENVKLNTTNTQLTTQLKDQTDALSVTRETVGSITEELAWTRSYLTNLHKPALMPVPPTTVTTSSLASPKSRGKKKPSNDVIDALRQWDTEHASPLSPQRGAGHAALREIYP